MKRRGKKIISMVLAVIMALSMFNYSGFPEKTVEAAGSFPVSGVHKGTLTHGNYMRLSGLKASTGASVIEADDMTSGGARRTSFCLSPGVSETGKENAYTSADYTSGYGIKYYKALIGFYYDYVNEYRTNAARFAAQLFVWRTVILERNHSGNFSASAYDGNGFRDGFVSSMKSLVGYDDATAEKVYDRVFSYIKEGAKGTYNNKIGMLKWTANASQTMLTGNVYSDKTVKIKIDKDLDQSGTGISLAGTQYGIYEDSEDGTKVGTFTLNKHGVDTILLKKDGTYDEKNTYYIKETKNVAGTTSSKNNKLVKFEIDWGKIKDGASGGTLSINKSGINGTKYSWVYVAAGFATLCKNQLTDKVPHISVDVEKKEDGTGKNLSGAEFTIKAYNSKTGKYDTKVTTETNLGHTVTNPIITGSDGRASSAELYYTSDNLGRFKITETKAPANHVNSGAERLFTIKSGNGVTDDSQTLKYSVTNSTIPQDYPVWLKKLDNETGTPIYDAEFTISVYKNKVDGKYYKFGTVDDGTPKYDMYWAETKKIVQKTENGELTNTYKTDYLKPGRTYQIVETKRPSGYASNGGYWGFGPGAGELIKTLADYDKNKMNMIIVFNLNSDGTIEMLSNRGDVEEKQKYTDAIEVNNNQASGEVTVVKENDVTGAKLQGAGFELWEVSKANYDKDGYIPSAENEDKLTATGETDENGEFTFGKLVMDENGGHRENGEVLAEHYYIAVETKAPDGYRLPENPTTKIYIGADEAQWTNSTFSNAFEKKYVIKNHEAKLDLNLHKVSVSRTGKESVALAGAKFALYKVGKIVSDGEVDDDTQNAMSETEVTGTSDVGADDEVGREVDYSQLTNENYIDFDYSKITPVVDNIITDKDGNAVIKEAMAAGGYVLVEKEAPKNYMVAEPQYIFIDDNTLYSTTSFEIEVRDKEFEARVRALKVDSDNGKNIPQEGVAFKVKNLDTNEYVKQTVDTYSEPEVEGAPHELIKSEITDTFYTDKNGEMNLPNVLSCGHYQLEEIVPPKGYLLNDTPVKFTVDDEEDYYPDDPNKQFDYDENTRDVVINLTFKDDATETYITKKDRDGKVLSGGKFHVEDTDGNIIESWEGTGEAHLIKKLEQGRKYVLVEDEPPKGYVTAANVEFTISETEKITRVEMTDDNTNVQITKTDITSGEPVAGAKLQIIDSEGNIVEEWITDENPHYINKLPIGDYTLREVKAPTSDGYVKAEDIGFAVKDTGEIQKVDMKDDYTKVKISKTDITGTEEIKGAKLKITDSEGNTVREWVTDGKPYYVEKIAPGKYSLIEEAAPDGFSTAEKIDFVVEETGLIQKVIMKDDTIKVRIVKVDSKDGNKRLQNAEFDFKLDGKTVASVKTDKNGEAEIEGILIAGKTYVISETKAPDGYKKKPDFKYTVKDTGEVQVITVKDERNGDATPNTPNWRNSGAKSPLTGDFSNPWMWVNCMMACICIITFVGIRRKKDEEK